MVQKKEESVWWQSNREQLGPVSYKQIDLIFYLEEITILAAGSTCVYLVLKMCKWRPWIVQEFSYTGIS